jgi:lipid-binding SYLF domain-containing protein
MKTIAALLTAVALSGAAISADPERLKDAAEVIREMATTDDKGIPTNLLNKARCVVVIPSLTKVAFGVGGQFGKGYLSCRTGSGWSAPGSIRVEGGSFGFQIGGSATDVILLIMNDRGMDKLLSNEFKVGADASVAAGPVGRQASAETDITMRAEMLAYSRSRGVFAGIAIQGSTLRQDSDENEELYGRKIPNREIVTGKVAVPGAAKPFIDALSKY